MLSFGDHERQRPIPANSAGEAMPTKFGKKRVSKYELDEEID
jgi:hypothetical protein